MSHVTRIALAGVLGAAGCGDPDEVAPTIESRSPGPGQNDVWLARPITVVFSEAIDPESATAQSVILTDSASGEPLAATRSVDGETLTIRITGQAAIPGEITIQLTEAITDPAGNALEAEGWSWQVPLWSNPGPRNRIGGAAAFPALSIGPDSSVVVVWQESDGSASRVFAGQVDGDGWQDLGDALGADGATGARVTHDAQGRPVAAWYEPAATGGSIQAARWDGDAWTSLASPGSGTMPDLALDPSGAPIIAWRSGDRAVSVRRLGATDDWEEVSDYVSEVAGSAALPGGLRLAVDSAGAVVIASEVGATAGDRSQGTIEVARLDGKTWTLLDPPPVEDYSAVGSSADARSPAIAIGPDDDIWFAYREQTAASANLRVVQAASGSAWQQIGGAIDIDPADDALSPSLALAADGTPFVAWTEIGDSRVRVYVARYDSAAGRWLAVGGGRMNIDADGFGGAPALAVHERGVPVVAWAEDHAGDRSRSDVWLNLYSGDDQPLFGLTARDAAAGCGVPADGAAPPALLSMTGCFSALGAAPVAQAGLVPFDLRSELWSDGALKRRWIALPGGATITPTLTGGWQLPVGTVLVKEFAYEMTAGDPTSRRPMETRLLMQRQPGVWEGYSYQWADDGSDASLLAGDVPLTKDWTVTGYTDNGDQDGHHTHSYPSRGQCVVCHNASAGFTLGLQTGNVNRLFDYEGIVDNQLRAMTNAGLLGPPTDVGGAGIGDLEEVAAFAAPHDGADTLYTRVRSYLSVNCAHCHNPTGVRPTRDFRWETPLADTKICEPSSPEIIPQNPSGSLLFLRISTRPGMPPLASLVSDPLALDVVTRWIAGVTDCATADQ